MNLRPLLAILVINAFVYTTSSMAQDLSDTSANEIDGNLVEVRTIDKAYESYKKRRGRHGAIFGLQYENYYPDAWESMVDQATYSDMYSNIPMKMLGVEIGYKFNFFAGSLAASVNYATGIISDTIIGNERTLEIHRNGFRLTYFMDNITEEPYGVPYAQVGIWDFGVVEKTDTGSEFTKQTKIGNSIGLGILMQLNWMDKDSARQAYLTSGLENTYLDLFVIQHSNTVSEDDPTTRTAFDWGAGLRLEY